MRIDRTDVAVKCPQDSVDLIIAGPPNAGPRLVRRWCSRSDRGEATALLFDRRVPDQLIAVLATLARARHPAGACGQAETRYWESFSRELFVQRYAELVTCLVDGGSHEGGRAGDPPPFTGDWRRRVYWESCSARVSRPGP